jgi:hypothetical protein
MIFLLQNIHQPVIWFGQKVQEEEVKTEAMPLLPTHTET